MTPYVLITMIVAIMTLAVFESLNGTNSIAIMVLGIVFATWEHLALERRDKSVDEKEKLIKDVDAIRKRLETVESTINLREGLKKR